MQFEPGVKRIGPFDWAAARREAEAAGFTAFVLPGSGVVDRSSFFDAVRATFPLDPPLVGSRSWEALSDSLWEGLHTHAARRIAILWPGTAAMASSAEADFDMALNVLEELVNQLADPEATLNEPKQVVVLVE
jgi:hypothetical protein